MHLTTALSLFSLAAIAAASPAISPLRPRYANASCTTPNGAGTCLSTSSCTTQGFNMAGFCPGASNIQCCVKKTCSTSSGSGMCLNTSDGCSGGKFVSGACPGDSSIKCCVSGGSSTPPSTPPSSGSGQSVVNKAVSQEGLPYVWGGGGCKGPSGGGFDCSGLTQYAICQSQGGKLIPRTADTQYKSSMGKHFPRAQAQAGDMLFWGENGDCNNVKHVGIFMRPGVMVNAAHTGTPVREQAIWTSSGGESICPDAVRFW